MEQEQITLEKIYFEIKKIEDILQRTRANYPQIGNKNPFGKISETTLLSEQSLAKEWLTSEEDEAWKDL